MRRKFLVFAAATLLVSCAWFGVSQAGNMRTGNSPALAADENVESSYYTAGNTVDIAGTIKGDLYCAGKTVTVSGTVEGDVMCGATSLRITGNVLGDVRVAGQNVTLTGKIAGSATVAAQTFTLEQAAAIGRDLTLGGAVSTLAGSVGRDVLGASEDAVVSGKIGRHLSIASSDVTLQGAATVGGNLTYESTKDAAIAEGAKVAGITKRNDPPQKDQGSASDYVTAMTIAFASMVLTGLLLLVATPRLYEATTTTLRNRRFWTLGIGSLVLMLVPFIVVLLLFSLIGVPLAILLLSVWVAGVIVAPLVSAYALGRLINHKLQVTLRWPRFSHLAIGLLVLFIVSLVPFIGGFGLAIAVIWGLGGLLFTIIEHMRSAVPPVIKKK